MTLETEFKKAPLQTEFAFTLPKGYVDSDGMVHKKGVMRLATAADEILPLKDHRVKNNPAYLSCIVLARTITKLGNVESISTTTIENLFAADLAFLQFFYKKINSGTGLKFTTVCPKCEARFETEPAIPDG